MPTPTPLPPTVQRSLDSLAERRAVGSDWGAPNNLVFTHAAVVDFGGVRHPVAIELSADNNDAYRLELLLDGAPVGEALLPIRALPSGGLTVDRVDLPPAAASRGADSVRITSPRGDDLLAIGHLILLEDAGSSSAPPEP